MSVLKYFKNTPRSPPHRATGLKCNFFVQIRNEVPGKKIKRTCRPPPNGRQAPVAPPTGDWAFFFLQGLRCKFEKKYTLGLSPYGRATGVYF